VAARSEVSWWSIGFPSPLVIMRNCCQTNAQSSAKQGGRTRLSREPSTRRAWARSWSCPKWAACITATSDAQPDRHKCPPCRCRHGSLSLGPQDDTTFAPTPITRPTWAHSRASTPLVSPIHPGSASHRRPDDSLAKDRWWQRGRDGCSFSIPDWRDRATRSWRRRSTWRCQCCRTARDRCNSRSSWHPKSRGAVVVDSPNKRHFADAIWGHSYLGLTICKCDSVREKWRLKRLRSA
jgi:hypothetical protein